MPDFVCNICRSTNSLPVVEWETPSCAQCGSNIRLRAIILMLSRELFGKAIPLPDFPVMRNIRGFGMSDHLGYAIPLAKKFDYVNTFYDQQPFLDITAVHPELYGTYDFILSGDVLEDVPMPVERSLDEAFKLLQPNGFLCITAPSSLEESTLEHFPDLHHHAVVQLGDEKVLVNRHRDGKIEVHENLVFHGGPGSTLEMRLLSQSDLRRRLRAVGFLEVTREDQEAGEFGIFYQHEWSRPMVARKGKFVLPPPPEAPPQAVAHQEPALPALMEARMETEMEAVEPSSDLAGLQSRVAEVEMQLRAVRDSKWVKLGNRLGLGPRVVLS